MELKYLITSYDDVWGMLPGGVKAYAAYRAKQEATKSSKSSDSKKEVGLEIGKITEYDDVRGMLPGGVKAYAAYRAKQEATKSSKSSGSKKEFGLDNGKKDVKAFAPSKDTKGATKSSKSSGLEKEFVLDNGKDVEVTRPEVVGDKVRFQAAKGYFEIPHYGQFGENSVYITSNKLYALQLKGNIVYDTRNPKNQNGQITEYRRLQEIGRDDRGLYATACGRSISLKDGSIYPTYRMPTERSSKECLVKGDQFKEVK